MWHTLLALATALGLTLAAALFSLGEAGGDPVTPVAQNHHRP